MRLSRPFLKDTEGVTGRLRDMDREISLAKTVDIWDKKALAYELAVEEKRHYRHRSALFVMHDVREKFDTADNEDSDTSVPSEYDFTLNFSGLDWKQKTKKVCAIFFILLEVPSSSGLAKFVSLIINCTIVLATLCFILSTEKPWRPVCDNDPILCPGVMMCPDEADPRLVFIGQLCTHFFTAEYCIRLLTCWSVSARVAGILPPEWEAANRFERGAGVQPEYSIWWSAIKYTLKYRNIVDLASILPTYVSMSLSASTQSQYAKELQSMQIIRVLRLLRLMSFMKNVDVARGLISETLRQSALILSVFLFFVMIIVILFGCLIYFCERGTFTVDSEYPDGAYLRQSSDGRDMLPSPFGSIATGIYWVVGTATGAGDLTATSVGGRAVSCALEVIGVLGLAIPVGVIGSELDRAYSKHFVRLMKISECKQAQLVQDAISSADLVLKKKPTREGSVTPPVEDANKIRHALSRSSDEKTQKAAEVFASAAMRFSAIKSKKSSVVSCASSQRTEPDDGSTQHLRLEGLSFSGDRRRSNGGKKSRGSSSKPMEKIIGDSAEPNTALESIKALVLTAKENVHRAVRHLRSLECLEKDMLALENASLTTPPGLSGQPMAAAGRWVNEGDSLGSDAPLNPSMCASSTSILSWIENRNNRKVNHHEMSSRASSTDDDDHTDAFKT